MLSQTGFVAGPTAADTWTTIGTETVPTGVKSIKKVRFGVAPDVGATATSIRIATVFRMRGSGLGEQDPHNFVGPSGGHGTTTDGAVNFDALWKEYDVDIPVNATGTFTVEVNTLDEAITAGTVLYDVIYSDEAPKAKNSMSDYVDATGTTTADAWATGATFTVPQGIAGKEPTMIKKVIIGIGIDQGTSAIALRLASRMRLTGSGIAESGTHEFLGPLGCTAQQGGTPVGSVSQQNNTVEYDVNIPVKAGGQIVAEQRYEIETPTASTFIVGLVYS